MSKKFRQKNKNTFKNSGYSGGGASLSKRTLKNWLPQHFSATSDIDLNLQTLRDRSHDLFINSPIGAACVNTMVSGVINEGLQVFPRLNAEALNLTSKEARAWENKTRREFNFWAESIDCDFYRRNNFREMQRIAFINQLVDGDCAALFRRRISGENPYSLKIQLVESARISNPNNTGNRIYNFNVESALPNGGRIVNGVEVDKRGVLKAIWIASRIPTEFLTTQTITEWTRVRVFGERAGEQNLCFLSNDSRIQQFRGTPLLASVIEILRNIARYTDAELVSAIIKTYLSFFFVQLQSSNNYGLKEILSEYDDVLNLFKLGPGSATLLPPGLDVKSINPAGASSTFEQFTVQLLKQVGAALNLPYEVLMKNFQSSYSASKAALLQAENEFRQRRKSFVVDFCQPIYKQFLSEAVALGKIAAPGYFENPQTRALWSNAEWHNESHSNIDAQKEIAAAAAKIELGLSTYTREAAELNGSDFEENLRRLAVERELLETSKI